MASSGGSKPRLLDLFCGAGGAAMGYHRAGFEVVGVDIKPQPNYPFKFVQADALEYLRGLSVSWDRFGDAENERYDAIHASPPCQAHTLHNGARDDHPDLIEPTRELLRETSLPYVIENVPGAPLLDPFKLCGSSFGLGVEIEGEWRQLRREREFEINWPFGSLLPPCAHKGRTVGIYGDHLRFGRRSSLGELSGDKALTYGSLAMGVGLATMTWSELKEAIPPAYTLFIGVQLMAHLLTTRGFVQRAGEPVELL